LINQLNTFVYVSSLVSVDDVSVKWYRVSWL